MCVAPQQAMAFWGGGRQLVLQFSHWFLAAVIAAVVARVTMPARNLAPLDGTTLALFLLVATPVQIVILVLASKRSALSAPAYLGLDVPSRRQVAIAVAGLAVAIVFYDALVLALGRDTVSPWVLELRRSAMADGSLICLWLAAVVAAPIGEEVLFRGFMFRGFVHAPHDAIPSIVLISLIWSLTHIHYDEFTITAIFVSGILLGLVRWRTGSTTLTILLHMLSNLENLIDTEIVPR